MKREHIEILLHTFDDLPWQLISGVFVLVNVYFCKEQMDFEVFTWDYLKQRNCSARVKI